MQIKFRVHDRERFPNGAVLDVDLKTLSSEHRRILASTLDGDNYCIVPTKIGDTGVNGPNLWLTEPTMASLNVELERIEKFLAEHVERANKRKRAVV